jgi:hypothetical protein
MSSRDARAGIQEMEERRRRCNPCSWNSFPSDSFSQKTRAAQLVLGFHIGNSLCCRHHFGVFSDAFYEPVLRFCPCNMRAPPRRHCRAGHPARWLGTRTCSHIRLACANRFSLARWAGIGLVRPSHRMYYRRRSSWSRRTSVARCAVG